MTPGEAAFRDYIAMYREAITETRYREVSELQPAPFANLSHGGAGTAYVLWRLGEKRRARAWLTAALDDRRRGAYQDEQLHPDRSSFLFGRAGVSWVRALVEPSPRAAAAYVRAARGAAASEVASGKAGALLGAQVLLAQREDATVRRLATDLAAELEERLAERMRRPWEPVDVTGFAHFWPGVLYSLLAWNPSASVTAAVRALVATWSSETVRVPDLRASWCNGHSGSLLLWAKSFAVTNDEVFLAAARDAARAALAHPPVTADLCCGVAGVAYSLLALDRFDRDGGWRDRARELGASAIERAAFRWPNGLFRGHPGLVCLAGDLLADRPAFPAIEA